MVLARYGKSTVLGAAESYSPFAAGGAEISQGQLTPLVERMHAFTKASNTRVAIMATGAGSVRHIRRPFAYCSCAEMCCVRVC